MKRSPSHYSPEDDQIRDALRVIQQRKRLEEENRRILWLIAGMIGVSWVIALVHSWF